MQEEIKKTIIEKMNLSGTTPEMQNKVIEESGLMIYQSALVRAMELMSEEEVSELENILNADKTPDEVFVYLQEKVKNFSDILGEEAEKLIGYMDKVNIEN